MVRCTVDMKTGLGKKKEKSDKGSSCFQCENETVVARLMMICQNGR